uniref:Gag-Pol polyprotein n=1 Tax=Tanacetum cinerariifolium TaxID=118510 RepID=A0A6L2LEG7_TANCI|nr:hypothetical protein [Tanacetum cinerariifolium]
MENYKNVSQDIHDQMNAEAEAVQIILTWIDNDIYSTVDAYPNACEMWKAIERLKQGESINVQDLETNLYWEFGKFTSRIDESLKSYYSRFYKMMNELVRNQCDVTNHQVNVQFLFQLQPEWKRFVTLVKQNQELKTVSYHKRYDILKQHQNEVNEIRAERLVRIANPLALVAQQQPVYYPQIKIPQPDDNKQSETEEKQLSALLLLFMIKNLLWLLKMMKCQRKKEIDKLIALISLSFKKIYKPTNNNLCTLSNTSRANQENSPRINRGTGYENQRVINVVEAWENVEQADWKDDTDDEFNDQKLEAHYMYMDQIQEVTPDIDDNSGPIFDTEPLQKVQNDDDNHNVFGDDQENPKQPASVNDPYLDMCYDREQDDQDNTDELTKERDLLASLIKKLKCEIDDIKNRNKFLETSNKTLVDKLKELDRYHDVNYASKVAIDYAKAKGDLMSYKIESAKSFNEYT